MSRPRLKHHTAQMRRYYSARKLQRKFRKKRSLQKQLTTLKKRVYKEEDNRFKNFSINVTQIPLAGAKIDIGYLNSIAVENQQQEGNGSRIGNEIVIKSVYMKGLLSHSNDDYNFVRCIIVQMPTTAGETISTSHFLDPSPGGTINIYSHYKKQADLKFRILKDTMYKVEPQQAGSYSPPHIYLDMKFKPPKNANKITYGAAAAGQPIKNPFYMFLISDSSASSHPTILLNCRVNYTA